MSAANANLIGQMDFFSRLMIFKDHEKADVAFLSFELLQNPFVQTQNVGQNYWKMLNSTLPP